MHPVNPLIAPAQAIPGLPPEMQQNILGAVNYIDLGDVPGSQDNINYLHGLINFGVNGDNNGNQGIEQLLEYIGPELATLSYIQTALEQISGGGNPVLEIAAVDIPELPIIQHPTLAGYIVQAHHVFEAWNHAVNHDNIDPDADDFANVQTLHDNIADVSVGLVATRNAMLQLQAMLPPAT